MRLFVSEFLCSGAWPGELTGSLLREGRAMLIAFLEDAARIGAVSIATTWDARLGPPPDALVEVHVVTSPEEERLRFDRLVHDCDATYLIAPEFDGHLTCRAQSVSAGQRTLIGSSVSAISLCTDKLRLAHHLQEISLATMETWAIDSESSPGFPCVVKPRDGAGSQDTFLLTDAAGWADLMGNLEADSPLHRGIVQPYLPGMAVSVALIMDGNGRCVHVFPPARQHLTADGRFHYLGGTVPAANLPSEFIQRLAADACCSVPGLRGYVGVDLIVPESAPDTAVVVEINPRLTTSYLGYRRLTEANLAEHILFPERSREAIRWQNAPISFTADGQCRPAD